MFTVCTGRDRSYVTSCELKPGSSLVVELGVEPTGNELSPLQGPLGWPANSWMIENLDIPASWPTESHHWSLLTIFYENWPIKLVNWWPVKITQKQQPWQEPYSPPSEMRTEEVIINSRKPCLRKLYNFQRAWHQSRSPSPFPISVACPVLATDHKPAGVTLDDSLCFVKL